MHEQPADPQVPNITRESIDAAKKYALEQAAVVCEALIELDTAICAGSDGRSAAVRADAWKLVGHIREKFRTFCDDHPEPKGFEAVKDRILESPQHVPLHFRVKHITFASAHDAIGGVSVALQDVINRAFVSFSDIEKAKLVPRLASVSDMTKLLEGLLTNLPGLLDVQALQESIRAEWGIAMKSLALRAKEQSTDVTPLPDATKSPESGRDLRTSGDICRNLPIKAKTLSNWGRSRKIYREGKQKPFLYDIRQVEACLRSEGLLEHLQP
jgi:hypothetical protein